MDIKDRKRKNTNYEHVFVGKECVNWITQNTTCKDRKHAVELGNRLVTKKVFHGVEEESFKDKDLFYQLLPEVGIIKGNPNAPKTLYQRLGGARAVAAVVDDFIDRVKINAVVNANPVVKEGFNKGSTPGLKYLVTEIVCMACGGPQKYTGGGMRSIHAGMKITDKEWDAFAGDFKGSLDKFKVPETEQGELFTIVGSLKPDIVTAASLYDRLGGIVGIATVVNDFVDRIVADPKLNVNPKLKEANSKVSVPTFKYYVTEFLGMVTGGPQKYSGRNMKESHKGMNISEEEWAAFAGDFKASLDKYKVPQKEQDECFKLVGSLKGEIVADPNAKKSLYDRLGGVAAIALVVDDFVDRVRSDNLLNSNVHIADAAKKGLPSSFKYSVTEIFCQATGGPQTYNGPSMKDSHRFMKITEREWQQFIALFKATCDKFKVPVQEQQEVLNIFNTLKGDIVTA